MNKLSIITPAYNCEKTIERTLYSIAGQTYQNWHMTVIDDMSTDSTVETVKDFIERNRLESKIEIISRKEKFGEVRNTLDIVKKIDPNDVVVRVDASDFITDLGCFHIVDEIYSAHPNIAVMWTAHRWAFTDTNISGPIDPNISVYHQPWKSSHLKTFRSQELLNVNEDNFRDNEGNWIMIACDQAVFLPMMENARRNGKTLAYLPRMMYHYDIAVEDPNLFKRDRSLRQKQSAENIRARGFIE